MERLGTTLFPLNSFHYKLWFIYTSGGTVYFPFIVLFCFLSLSIVFLFVTLFPFLFNLFPLYALILHLKMNVLIGVLILNLLNN
jgi:hypothetical protein